MALKSRQTGNSPNTNSNRHSLHPKNPLLFSVGTRLFLLSFFLIGLWAQKPSKKAKGKESTRVEDTTLWRHAIQPYVKGVVLFAQGLTEESAEYFYKAAEIAPHNPAIHYYLARLAYHQGDYLRMLTHAEKAYKEAPHELWFGLGYASALVINDQVKEAVQILIELQQRFPNEPEILLRLAQGYQSLGELEKADALYSRLQHMGGGYEEILQARIQMFVEAEQLGKAIAIAESAATLWITHESYWEILARLYELSRDLPRMAQVVAHLLSIDPANQVAWNLVLAYPEVFEEMWGDEVWEKFLEQDATPIEVKYALLRRLETLETTEYIETLGHLLQVCPLATGWDLWAQYWAKEGKWDSAAVAWKRAIQQDTNQLSLYWSYFYALWQLGGGDSLAREVERLEETLPGQGRLFLWKGIALAQCRQWRQAITAFNKGWHLATHLDTSLAQIAAYYHLVAEAAQKKVEPSTQRRFLSWYERSLGSALLALILFRHEVSEVEAAQPPVSLKPPYQEWFVLLSAIRQKRFEEARRIAASMVEENARLPLEAWEDILTRLDSKVVGSAYKYWKGRAQQQYPLAFLWHELP
ncbi:MAG: hypothetical protein RMJ66_01410 [Bacteroidia bacterium]|nr:hypothetical protein [Bacteroidia bacterium]MDW8133702.1 hypothetical protein [Bacteroidia bacterium]